MITKKQTHQELLSSLEYVKALLDAEIDNGHDHVCEYIVLKAWFRKYAMRTLNGRKHYMVTLTYAESYAFKTLYTLLPVDPDISDLGIIAGRELFELIETRALPDIPGRALQPI